MEELERLEQALTGADSATHLNDIRRIYELCESSELRVVAEALKAIGRVLSHHRQRLRAGGDAAVVEWLKQHQEAYHAALLKLAVSSAPRAQVCAIRLAMANVRQEAGEARSSLFGAGSGAGGVAAPPPPDKRVQDLLTEMLLAPEWGEQAARCFVGEFMCKYVDVHHQALSHIRFCCTQMAKYDWGQKDGQDPASKRRKLQAAVPIIDTMRRRGLLPGGVFSRFYALLSEAPQPTAQEKKMATASARHGADAGAAGGDPDDPDGDPPDAEDDVLAQTGQPASYFRREYKHLFQEAWLQLLGLGAPLDQCSSILQFVPNHVLPHLGQPLLLSDFYLKAFHHGSTEVCVLALSGLLLLLTKYGLGDPDALSSSCAEFYAQLYSLVKPETFQLKKRARFQRLLAASLWSGLLPARFAAAFAKRCMRTAVSVADPGSMMWLISVAYTLIQRHHSHCEYLLHCPPSSADSGVSAKGNRGGDAAGASGRAPTSDGQAIKGEDPFNANAPLAEAMEGAARSSLWELRVFLRHHIPQVATLARLFLKPFFKPSARKLDSELFLDQSTAKMYAQALKSSERQVGKLRARGQFVPLAFSVEDDSEAMCVAAWAATLSTTQRQIGADI